MQKPSRLFQPLRHNLSDNPTKFKFSDILWPLRSIQSHHNFDISLSYNLTSPALQNDIDTAMIFLVVFGSACIIDYGSKTEKGTQNFQFCRTRLIITVWLWPRPTTCQVTSRSVQLFGRSSRVWPTTNHGATSIAMWTLANQNQVNSWFSAPPTTRTMTHYIVQLVSTIHCVGHVVGQYNTVIRYIRITM